MLTTYVLNSVRKHLQSWVDKVGEQHQLPTDSTWKYLAGFPMRATYKGHLQDHGIWTDEDWKEEREISKGKTWTGEPQVNNSHQDWGTTMNTSFWEHFQGVYISMNIYIYIAFINNIYKYMIFCNILQKYIIYKWIMYFLYLHILLNYIIYRGRKREKCVQVICKVINRNNRYTITSWKKTSNIRASSWNWVLRHCTYSFKYILKFQRYIKYNKYFNSLN